MTNEEREAIRRYNIFISGTPEFEENLENELRKIGFTDIHQLPSEIENSISDEACIFIKLVFDDKGIILKNIRQNNNHALIYLFDFIEGAGAIVLFSHNFEDLIIDKNTRYDMAKYISGYNAFWNIETNSWLTKVLDKISHGSKNDDTLKTAAYLGAKIAANIATGRDVKIYPRFYLLNSVKEDKLQ